MTKLILITAMALAFISLPARAAPINILPITAAPVDGTNEVQTLTFGASVTGGTFTLGLTGSVNQTAAIAWSATTNTILANISNALTALPQIGSDGVTVTAGTISGGHGTVLVTFDEVNTARLDVPLLKIVKNAMTGAVHTLTVASTTAGVTATYRDSPPGTKLINQLTGAEYYTDHGGPLVHWRQSVAAPTPTPTPSVTPTATPSATPTASPSATPTASPSATVTPTATPTATP